jgi:hypothetical protein
LGPWLVSSEPNALKGILEASFGRGHVCGNGVGSQVLEAKASLVDCEGGDEGRVGREVVNICKLTDKILHHLSKTVAQSAFPQVK